MEQEAIKSCMNLYECCVECFRHFTFTHCVALQICMVVILSGAFGGCAGGLYRRLRKLKPIPCGKRDYLCYSICGAISALAIMVVCLWMGLVYENPNLVSRALYIVGVSSVAGFFAMRILPNLGDVIDDKFRQMSNEIKSNKKETDDELRRINDDFDYNRVVGRAEVALNTKNKADYAEAIACIEESLPRFAHRRTINVYYGRLLRRMDRLQDAIAALENFVLALKRRKEKAGLISNDKDAISVAYLNIACYYRLQLSKDFKPDSIRAKVRDALLESIKYNSKVREEWKEDPDLNDLAAAYPDLV